MKKMAVFSIILAAVVVGVAVWFSPLAFSNARQYADNAEAGALDGLAYPDWIAARADYFGSETDMYAALDGMLASPVASACSGGSVVVYAYSPRVPGKPHTLRTGEKYNVMAAYRDGRYAIGTPVLEGSF